MSLEDIYADMNKRNCPSKQEPQPNPTLGGRCYAVYALGDWYLRPSWRRLVTKLQAILPKNTYCLYKPLPETGEGLLHQTLLQYIGFDAPKDDADKATDVVHDVMKSQNKALWIQYRGLVWTSTGLAMAGYLQNPIDYDYIMDTRRKIELALTTSELPCFVPYKNDIVHSTLIRWTKLPDAYVLERLQEEVAKWQECELGEIRIRNWTIGEGSWQQLRQQRTDIYSVPLYRHICHRGNLEKKIEEIENRPLTLAYRDVEGYDVECDVWYKDNKLWLGHDEPQYETFIEWLAVSPRRLIHAKDGETFAYLLQEAGKRAYDLHVFYHTDEDYVLTSKGIIIAHPEKPLVDGALAMMPEMGDYKVKDRHKLFFLCSDRLDGFSTYFSH